MLARLTVICDVRRTLLGQGMEEMTENRPTDAYRWMDGWMAVMSALVPYSILASVDGSTERKNNYVIILWIFFTFVSRYAAVNLNSISFNRHVPYIAISASLSITTVPCI